MEGYDWQTLQVQSSIVQPIDGLYLTVNVRTLMWHLRMKPLVREDWDNAQKKQFL